MKKYIHYNKFISEQFSYNWILQWEFVWWKKANWKGYRYPVVCVVKESKLERIQISSGISCMGLTSSLNKYNPLELNILSFWFCWAYSIYAKNIDKSHISVENFDRVPQCSTEVFQCSSNGVLIRSKLAPSTEFDIVFFIFFVETDRHTVTPQIWYTAWTQYMFKSTHSKCATPINTFSRKKYQIKNNRLSTRRIKNLDKI